MRRLVCLFMILSCLLCLDGCGNDKRNSAAEFYYVRADYAYGKEDGVISAEPRDTAVFTDAREILNNYLLGPQDATLVSPFPYGTEILEYVYKGETLHITLSSHMVALSKANQVLACTCFARTAIELTGVKAVRFESDNSTVARMDPIVISKDSYLLYDDYGTVAPDE
jgi:spore germination protein GerM